MQFRGFLPHLEHSSHAHPSLRTSRGGDRRESTRSNWSVVPPGLGFSLFLLNPGTHVPGYSQPVPDGTGDVVSVFRCRFCWLVGKQDEDNHRAKQKNRGGTFMQFRGFLPHLELQQSESLVPQSFERIDEGCPPRRQIRCGNGGNCDCNRCTCCHKRVMSRHPEHEALCEL